MSDPKALIQQTIVKGPTLQTLKLQLGTGPFWIHRSKIMNTSKLKTTSWTWWPF